MYGTMNGSAKNYGRIGINCLTEPSNQFGQQFGPVDSAIEIWPNREVGLGHERTVIGPKDVRGKSSPRLRRGRVFCLVLPRIWQTFSGYPD